MYEQFYGLTGRPFQLTPDPEFYFESASHKKAMSYLGYGLQQGEGFIVITGEIGAGKSTLVAHLMQCIDPTELTVAHVVTSALDGEELVHVVAQSFGLAVDGHDKAGALGAIEYFLGEEARAGRRCLLVVDESQNLDIGALEELRMLSNFQLGSYPLLQTLLLGQPEFRSLLANSPKLEQLRQRIIASHHLSALKPEEVQNYVEHRMEHVGWEGRPSFADGFHASLYQATGGIPRRVNQVMNRMLLLGAIEERGEFTSQMLATVMAEMAGDATAGSPQAVSISQSQRPVAQPKVEVNPADDAAVASMLAERDTRIAELEQAVDKLHRAAARPVVAQGDASSEELAEIRQRLDEQEHSLRHILTMLIEFFEDSTSREGSLMTDMSGHPIAAHQVEGRVVNGLSVDVEEWFQVGAFETTIDRSDWDGLRSRVEGNIDLILDLFGEAGAKATFFSLGWVAERHPAMMRRIADAGHEIASHGYDHARVFNFSRVEFAQDLQRSRRILEDVSGQKVTGYRAPSFSIDKRTPWAHEVLAEHGYCYSSSVAPVVHDHYGWPEAPRFAFHPVAGSDLLEIPVTTAEIRGKRLAAGGGGFFRVLPYAFSRWAIRQVNLRDERPAVFYFHPWEVDPDQPRVENAPLKSRLRHYTNLEKMAGKLRSLAGEFAWGRMDEIAEREAMRTVEFTA